MPDELLTPGASPVSGAEVPAAVVPAPKSKKGLFIIGAVAVLAIVASVGAAVLVFTLQGASNDISVKVVPPGGKQSPTASSSTTDGAVAAAPADDIALDEVFTFRDIFDPLVGPVATSTSTSSTAGSSNDSTAPVDTADYSADTLYLVSISSDSGSPTAHMVWDKIEYALSEGDSIPNSPWKVLEIRTDDVVMLFGDQQVVLSVGQGINK